MRARSPRPWTPIFPKDLKYGTQIKPGIIAPSSPTTPVPPTGLGVLRDSISLNCDRMAIRADDVAFVVSFADDALYSINIADPTNIFIIDTLIDNTNLNGAFDINLRDDGQLAYICAADGNRLTVVDISDASNLGPVTTTLTTGLDFPSRIVRNGTVAYVGCIDTDPRFNSINLATTPPTLLDSVNIGVGVPSIAFVGQFAYIGFNASSDLGRIDITDPTNLGTLASLGASISNVTEDMVLIGTHLFTAGAGIVTNGVFAVNVSDPASPSFVSSLIENTLMQGTRSIDAAGSSHVVVGCSAANRIHLIDVSNPASMSITDTINNLNLNGVRDVKVYKDHVYTASRASGSTFAAWSLDF